LEFGVGHGNTEAAEGAEGHKKAGPKNEAGGKFEVERDLRARWFGRTV
jgi:hypothetical protein